MEVRDPVHGSIHIYKEEEAIIKHPFVERLRHIKQVGLLEFGFPGATHTRFLHSIGVMSVGTKAFDRLFRERLSDTRIQRIREAFRLACLLHDIGHAPLSHSTERAMPSLRELNIPEQYLEHEKDLDRQASHEDYSLKILIDSSFTESFTDVSRTFGVEPHNVADLISGKNFDPYFYTVDGINYFHLLNQLVSSEIDCDRMDYLLRDSYFCGVSYGNFDLDWLIDNLEICIDKEVAYLGISERALATFDDFLLSRYHMFLQVYFHYKPVCLEQFLFKYFETAGSEYVIPAEIEEYLDHDDHYLRKVLMKSSNPYAKKLINNDIPPKIYESFNPTQLLKLEEVEQYLEKNQIEYIRCSSSKRLSKYYQSEEPASTIKVVKKLYHTNSIKYQDIHEATDLFEKYSRAHSIDRLHCDLTELTSSARRDIVGLLNK